MRCGHSLARGDRISNRIANGIALRRLTRGDGADAAIDLQRVFGPNVGHSSSGRNWQQTLANNPPPPIGVGEIRTSAGQDVGALELLTRFAEMRRRNPGAQLPLGGLVTTTPTGLVRYTVADPNNDRIVWQGNLARLPSISQVEPAQREREIRALLQRITGQRFRNLRYPHAGPDLVPSPVRPRPNRFDGFDDGDDADAYDAMDALDEALGIA